MVLAEKSHFLQPNKYGIGRSTRPGGRGLSMIIGNGCLILHRTYMVNCLQNCFDDPVLMKSSNIDFNRELRKNSSGFSLFTII